MNIIVDKILNRVREGGDGVLPTATQAGTTVAYNGSEWEARYGEKHVTVTGDFLGENGYLYVLNLEQDMTVRIGAVNSLEDYEFDMLVFQGYPIRQLDLLGDHHPIWWADTTSTPATYDGDNPPPGLGDANSGYLIHFTWSSDARVLFARVDKKFDAVRGVLLSYNDDLVDSAMTFTGETLGASERADRMDIYNRGVASNTTINAGGAMYVSAGGFAGVTGVNDGGEAHILADGVASNMTVDSGTLSVERGTVDGIVVNGGNVNATSNAIISGGTITQSGVVTVTESEINGVGVGGTLTVSSGGVATSAVVVTGGTARAYNGGAMFDTVISSGGNTYIFSGGVATNTLTISGGTILVLSGASATNVNGNGTLRVSAGAVATSGTLTDASISTFGDMSLFTMVGGAINVNAGTVHDCVTSNGTVNVYSAMVQNHVLVGGYVIMREISAKASGILVSSGSFNIRGGTASGITVLAGGQAIFSGGVTTDITFSSGASAIVNSGGIASHFTSVDGATVNILSGGSATTNGTAYGVSVESGGAMTVESVGVLNIQSGKTAYGVVALAGGTVYVSSGGTANGTQMYGKGVVYGSMVDWTVVKSGSFNPYVNAYPRSYISKLTVGSGGSAYTFTGSASDVTIVSGGFLQTFGGTITNVQVESGRVLNASGRLIDVTIGGGGTVSALANVVESSVTVLNGGTLTVFAGGSALDVVAEPDAVITSAEGATVTYAQPINAVQGVFYSSGGSVISSAMVVSGGTIAPEGDDIARMTVYSRGRALDMTTLTGSGQIYVSSGGFASGTTVSGFLFVYSGGAVSDTEVWYRETLRGGTAYNTTVMSGVQTVSSGGTAIGTTVVSLGLQYVSSGGVARDTIISSGGQMIVYDGGVASAPTISSGGKLTVSSGGLALNVTAENPNDVVVIEGGTIYPQIG